MFANHHATALHGAPPAAAPSTTNTFVATKFHRPSFHLPSPSLSPPHHPRPVKKCHSKIKADELENRHYIQHLYGEQVADIIEFCRTGWLNVTPMEGVEEFGDSDFEDMDIDMRQNSDVLPDVMDVDAGEDMDFNW